MIFRKNVLNTPFYLLILITFCSGVIRHDVDETKYLELASQKQFDCVGKVVNDTDKLKGSCVFIGTKYVLSVAHVFMEYDFHPDTMKIGGQTVIANVASNPRIADVSKYFFEFNGRRYQGKSIIIHPNYLNKSTKGSCDIAIVELQENVNDILPITLNNSFDELNEDVVGVGYGASGIANKPKTVVSLRKKIGGENIIDSIGGKLLNNIPTLLYSDFDSPTDTTLNRMGNSTPKPLEYVFSGGDSGGGLFRRTRKSWELVGLAATTNADMENFAKNGYYGSIMGWTRVSSFKSWIMQTLNKK